jgi:hypothetical protein
MESEHLLPRMKEEENKTPERFSSCLTSEKKQWIQDEILMTQ